MRGVQGKLSTKYSVDKMSDCAADAQEKSLFITNVVMIFTFDRFRYEQVNVTGHWSFGILMMLAKWWAVNESGVERVQENINFSVTLFASSYQRILGRGDE